VDVEIFEIVAAAAARFAGKTCSKGFVILTVQHSSIPSPFLDCILFFEFGSCLLVELPLHILEEKSHISCLG